MPAPEACLLLIGSELTEGRLTDKNGPFLAAQLSQMGFQLGEIRILPDDSAKLRSAMQEALHSRAELILSSGGLGHTRDDLTATLWAEILEDKLTVSESLLNHLQATLRERGISKLPYIERYALAPTRGKFFLNPVGLAPALYWDLHTKVICALPGPPAELQSIWHVHLKPYLQNRFSLKPPLEHTIKTTGITESRLSELIASWEANLPVSIHLAYNPSWEGVSLHLRASPEIDRELFFNQIEKLRALLKPYIYTEGAGSLAECIIKKLRERGLTLAVAESCTGGHITASVVNVAGASDVLKGGVVAYANSTKIDLLGVVPEVLQTEGAVSESTALQMAEGVRKALHAHVGVATTGIAGPTGGSAEKPVGTVWIGIATPIETYAKRFVFSGGREVVIQRATATALSLLWQALGKNS
ncbi:MAG: nicotinamide-nucleotide amidohydrolase family protein [Bacteroidia bacterium]|nr:nicotinamide-nucleotide amidohydrolase family protein [Bacteroidia bacterium]MDW8133769.1 nicotinamide-nucleotide amidohydrolase family protein [Bacteroidia bacterium]